jgi:hypothetical protein
MGRKCIHARSYVSFLKLLKGFWCNFISGILYYEFSDELYSSRAQPKGLKHKAIDWVCMAEDTNQRWNLASTVMPSEIYKK